MRATWCLICPPPMSFYTYGSYIWFVADSEPPLSDQPQHLSDPGLISLLRAELGLSSSDLFSMTVSDYDMKPAVSPRLLPLTPGSRLTFFLRRTSESNVPSLVPCPINFPPSLREFLRRPRQVLLSSNTSTTSPPGAQKKRRRGGILRSAPTANSSLQPRTHCSGAAAFCNADVNSSVNSQSSLFRS